MKKLQTIISIACLVMWGCNPQPTQNETEKKDTVTMQPEKIDESVYSNDRFKEVQVEQIAPDTYKVTGKAQVFEATLSYVVEDGHYELAKGFTTTDAGAPEFGNFEFTVNVEKDQPNSTRMLILFESSPKDGSRTHELIIPLD